MSRYFGSSLGPGVGLMVLVTFLDVRVSSVMGWIMYYLQALILAHNRSWPIIYTHCKRYNGVLKF